MVAVTFVFQCLVGLAVLFVSAGAMWMIGEVQGRLTGRYFFGRGMFDLMLVGLLCLACACNFLMIIWFIGRGVLGPLGVM